MMLIKLPLLSTSGQIFLHIWKMRWVLIKVGIPFTLVLTLVKFAVLRPFDKAFVNFSGQGLDAYYSLDFYMLMTSRSLASLVVMIPAWTVFGVYFFYTSRHIGKNFSLKEVVRWRQVHTKFAYAVAILGAISTFNHLVQRGIGTALISNNDHIMEMDSVLSSVILLASQGLGLIVTFFSGWIGYRILAGLPGVAFEELTGGFRLFRYSRGNKWKVFLLFALVFGALALFGEALTEIFNWLRLSYGAIVFSANLYTGIFFAAIFSMVQLLVQFTVIPSAAFVVYEKLSAREPSRA